MKNKYRRSNIQYTEDGWSILSGWGVYDSDDPYKWRVTEDGKKVVKFCPYFKIWDSVVKRCTVKRGLSAISYKHATICKEWKYFSNFKRWVDEQPNRDWKSCELDKDLLILGNNEYSPYTCCFLPQKINGFLKFVKSRRGSCMIGASYKPSNKIRPFQADCSNPFTGKNEYLGSFTTELEAHLAWKRRKEEFAVQFSKEVDDSRVSAALVHRYSEQVDWSCV